MKKILVIDDEPNIVTLLKYNLEKEGYGVDTAEEGRKGLEIALTGQHDFIILDLMLPGLDGIEICKRIRQAKIDTPILMLTAKDDELDKIIGLELGADDYMTKPFSPRELLARIKVIFRRVQSSFQDAGDEKEEVLSFSDLQILPERHQVFLAQKEVELTPKEFELLLYLAKKPGRTLSRDRLLEKIWGFDYTGETRMVDVHIGKLREKIEQDTKNPHYIKTVRGYGYKFAQGLGDEK